MEKIEEKIAEILLGNGLTYDEIFTTITKVYHNILIIQVRDAVISELNK